jgi:hypothetical protein
VDIEALLREMPVKTECIFNATLAHDPEAGPVCQADASLVGGDQRCQCLFVKRLVNPHDFEDGLEIRPPFSYRTHPDSGLQQRERFQYDIG